MKLYLSQVAHNAPWTARKVKLVNSYVLVTEVVKFWDFFPRH